METSPLWHWSYEQTNTPLAQKFHIRLFQGKGQYSQSFQVKILNLSKKLHFGAEKVLLSGNSEKGTYVLGMLIKQLTLGSVLLPGSIWHGRGRSLAVCGGWGRRLSQNGWRSHSWSHIQSKINGAWKYVTQETTKRGKTAGALPFGKN